MAVIAKGLIQEMTLSKKGSRSQGYSGGGTGINPISPKLRIYSPEAGPKQHMVDKQSGFTLQNENEPPMRLLMSPRDVQ